MKLVEAVPVPVQAQPLQILVVLCRCSTKEELAVRHQSWTGQQMERSDGRYKCRRGDMWVDSWQLSPSQRRHAGHQKGRAVLHRTH